MLPQSTCIGQKKLTPYPQGSVRELWQISFPLMISLMSVSLMLFLDRLFLSRYSIDALNASANAGILTQLMQFWCLSTVSIAEVFVGRYNGAGRLEKLGQPVWQMVWLSIASFLWFIPIGLWAGPYFFHNDPYYSLESAYFKYLMCFGPMAALSAALSAFYIGRGKVKFVTWVMGLSNLVNVVLDWILIFGWEPFIPSLGIMGAALATGVAQTTQVLIFGCDFLRASNRSLYGTNRWKLNKRLFRKCLSIGIPNAIAHTLELLAWVFIFHLMTKLGSDYITVVSVSQSIFFLFTFMTEGVSKGATAIAANMIGSQQHELVWKLLKSGLKLYSIVFLLLGIFLAWNPDPLISLFLGQEAVISPATRETLHAACFWVWLFFLFDGINWLLIGLLTAAGDTRFIMKVGGAGPWLVALLPIYFFVFKWGAPANITWMLIALYGIASSIIYLWRFRSEKWKVIVLA
ncbi:MATE family efflux transporter [Candidatus Protochlamydia phocaeensis]|uniref:MATE family efflux transporter n=1 Tax=Candidatus Protochlamydia phocaeensis TaxID=1414722 RepID=UPI000839277F|nr:MATE family efflux transporter [Candidatus Protochlamydia phocaeensis]